MGQEQPDKSVHLDLEEYRLLIGIYDTAAAVQLGLENPVFAEACGGQEFLARRHRIAIKRYQSYRREHFGSSGPKETCA